MEREAIVWLALFVILLIVELLTVGLTSFDRRIIKSKDITKK